LVELVMAAPESRTGAAMSATITFTIPPPAESPFTFRRALLDAIRSAISAAQVAGEIDAQAAVECCRALPMAEPGVE
jgi:hypothetical protein